MPALRTLPASNTPRVIFLGHQPEVLAMAQQLFSAHDIEVLALEYQDFLQIDATSLEADSIYKFVWWLEWDHPLFEKVVTAVKKADLSSVVFTGVYPEAERVFPQPVPSQTARQQQLLGELSRDFSEAQWYLARDLLVSPPPPFLQHIFSGEKKNVLVNTGSDVFFIDIPTYFNEFSQELTQPQKQKKTVIQGKKRPISHWVKQLEKGFFQYFQRKMQVVLASGERVSPEENEFIMVTAGGDPQETIDELLRSYQSWKAAVPKVEEGVFDQWKRGDFSAPKQKKIEKKPQENGPAKKVLPREKKSDLTPSKQSLVSSAEPAKPVENKLSHIFKHQRKVDQSKRIQKKTEIVKKITKKSQKNKALFMGGIGVMIMGGVVLVLFALLYTSTFFARKEVVSSFETPQALFEKGFQSQPWLAFLGKQVEAYRSVVGEGLLGKGLDLTSFLRKKQNFLTAKEELDTVLSEFILGMMGVGESSSLLYPSLQEKVRQSDNASKDLEEAFTAIDPEWFTDGEESEELQEYQKLLTLERERITALRQIEADLPDLLGENGKKTYAVLLQNNLELRPTGGFIQAVALFTFDNGILIDVQLKSVYELDDRLPGAVEAPREIQKYLGEQNWYLRDGNWDPDFPTTAERVSWFLQESLAKSVDGVIAVDYGVFQATLEALGPLELVEYDEVLTAQNLLERVEFHSDDELVNNQSQQVGYPLTFFSKMIEHLRNSSPSQLPEFGEKIYEQLEESNLLVAIFDQEKQPYFQANGWAGEVVDPSCPARFPGENCVVDQAYVVETNIGVNRVNDYIRREAKHEVDLTGERATHVRTLTLENTARTESWPLGTYRTYLRFMLDKEARPKSLKINQQKVDSQRVLMYTQDDRRIVGVSLEVPKEKIMTVELEYETEAIPEVPYSYLLFNQKQPGIRELPLTVSFYHAGVTPVLVAPKADLFGNTLEFTNQGKSNFFAGASFEQ